MAVGPDGFAAGFFDGGVTIYNALTGAAVASLQASHAFYCSLVPLPSRHIVVVAENLQGTTPVVAWDPQTGAVVRLARLTEHSLTRLARWENCFVGSTGNSLVAFRYDSTVDVAEAVGHAFARTGFDGRVRDFRVVSDDVAAVLTDTAHYTADVALADWRQGRVIRVLAQDLTGVGLLSVCLREPPRTEFGSAGAGCSEAARRDTGGRVRIYAQQCMLRCNLDGTGDVEEVQLPMEDTLSWAVIVGEPEANAFVAMGPTGLLVEWRDGVRVTTRHGLVPMDRTARLVAVGDAVVVAVGVGLEPGHQSILVIG